MKFWDLFNTRHKLPPIRIVERQRLSDLERGDDASIPALAVHPGFQALNYKLRLMQDSLRSRLECNRHDDIRSVDFIQSGIAWLGFLERELAAETKKERLRRDRGTTPEEQFSFDQVSSFIEGVGSTKPDK